jgi:hypothetical protein
MTMVRLIRSAIESLDGYVFDESGNFDCAAPVPEGVRVTLELIDQRGFRSGVVQLRYRTT